MNRVLFFITLAAETLAAVLVVVSILVPQRRIWPPVRERAWTGTLMRLVFAVSAAGVIAVGILDRGSLPLPAWLRFPLGVPLWVGGCAFAFWAMTALGSAMTFGGEDSLVQHGPYRLSRNPQYVGFMLGLAGWALVCSSAMALLAALAGVVPLVLVPLAEEPWLAARYGEAYTAYRRTVPRFLIR